MTRLSVPDTIELADVSIYLSANYQGNGNLFGERLATTAPQTIALVSDALRWHYESFPAISITDAVGSITVDNVGNDGDTITVLVHDVVLGTIILGTYTKNSSDTTTSILATHIAAALTNLNGYTVTVLDNIITITVRPGLGSSMNGGNRLQAIINVPTITAVGSLIFPNTIVGNNSASQYFLVSGTTLYNAPGSITIVSPSTDFEVSNDNVNWGSSTTISFVSDIIYNAQVFVRFTPQSLGALSTNLQITGGGVTVPVLMPASGNGVNAPSLSATPIDPFPNTPVLTNSASQISYITGSNLVGFPGVITINAPNTNYQVSNNNTTWGSTTTIPYTSGTLSSTPIYIRFTPQTVGIKSGNVGVSGSTTSTTIAVTSTGVVEFAFEAFQMTEILFDDIQTVNGFTMLWNASDVTTAQNFAAGQHFNILHTYPSAYTGNVKLQVTSLADVERFNIAGGGSAPLPINNSTFTVRIQQSELVKLTGLTSFKAAESCRLFGVTTANLNRSLERFIAYFSYMTGSIGLLPVGLEEFNLLETNSVSGTINSMYANCPNLTSFTVGATNSISGTISSINPATTIFLCTDSNTIGGTFASLPSLPNIIYFVINGNNTISGNIEDMTWTNLLWFEVGGSGVKTGDVDNITFNSSMFAFSMAGNATAISGSLSQFPNSIEFFNVQGTSTLTGTVADVPTSCTTFAYGGSCILTGNVSGLPSTLQQLIITGASSNVTGTISSLPPNLRFVKIENNVHTVSGYATSRPWGTLNYTVGGERTMCKFSIFGSSVPSNSNQSEVNQLIIDLNAAETWTNSTSFAFDTKVVNYVGIVANGAGLIAKNSLVARGVPVNNI